MRLCHKLRRRQSAAGKIPLFYRNGVPACLILRGCKHGRAGEDFVSSGGFAIMPLLPTGLTVSAYPPSSFLFRLTVAFIGALAFMQIYSIQSILPLLMRHFQADEVQIGLAVGVTVMGMGLMSPFIGMLSDAFGRRWMICSAIFFYSLPVALSAYAPTIESFILLRFLVGVFVPGMTVCLIAYLGEEFESEHIGKLMAFYVCGTVFGGFSGRFLLGHLTQWIGWQFSMLLLSGLSFAGFLLVLWQLPPSRHFVAKPQLSTAMRSLVSHLHNRIVLSSCALGFFVLFSLVGCFSFINLRLAQAPYHLNTAQLANIFSVYLIGMIITPAATWLLRKFGAPRTMALSLALSVCGIVISLAQPLMLVFCGLILMSTGVFITQSATISYISLHVREGRSLATGLYYMAYYCGGTAGAWLCALSFQTWQWQGVVGTLLLAQCIGLIIIFSVIWQTSPRAQG